MIPSQTLVCCINGKAGHAVVNTVLEFDLMSHSFALSRKGITLKHTGLGFDMQIIASGKIYGFVGAELVIGDGKPMYEDLIDKTLDTGILPQE